MLGLRDSHKKIIKRSVWGNGSFSNSLAARAWGPQSGSPAHRWKARQGSVADNVRSGEGEIGRRLELLPSQSQPNQWAPGQWRPWLQNARWRTMEEDVQYWPLALHAHTSSHARTHELIQMHPCKHNTLYACIYKHNNNNRLILQKVS